MTTTLGHDTMISEKNHEQNSKAITTDWLCCQCANLQGPYINDQQKHTTIFGAETAPLFKAQVVTIRTTGFNNQ